MANMRVLFWLTSLAYFITVIALFCYLPSFRNTMQGSPADDQPQLVFHPHILASRTAEEVCRNQTYWALYSPEIRPIRLHQNLYPLSAYYDKRLGASHYIRILAYMSTTHAHKVNLHCHVRVNEEQSFTMPANPYELNEHHARVWRGYIFSCPLPANLAAKLPICSVQVTDGSHTTDPGVWMTLIEVPRQRESPDRVNFTVCLPPLYGRIDLLRFVEFVEATRLLGAQHFQIYDHSAAGRTPELERVFGHYRKQGLLTVRRWELPVHPATIWYYGQGLAIHHCLYQSMGQSKYTVFQDIDELIVPRHSYTWTQLMDQVDKGFHAGYRIFSVFFEPNQAAENRQPLLSLNSLMRTLDVNRFRTKCIVRPDLIFEMGIHHISKQNVEEATPEDLDETRVLLHHYRSCDTMFAMNCRDRVKDTTMEKYATRLEHAFGQAVIELDLTLNTSAVATSRLAN